MSAQEQLALELRDAYANRRQVTAPSIANPAFDLDTAYAVEAELTRLRRADGHRPVGRKVGFANKAMWRALKLETLVWAHMYDDTVQMAGRGTATLALERLHAPKVEPEIVFKLKHPVEPGGDAAATLASVEWIALGFEIIDCVYPDWKFTPVDFVAAYGLHAGLVVGEPLAVEAEMIPALVEQLASFKVALLKNGEQVDEGSGKNSLRNPALCLGELAAAIVRRGQQPLAAGDLISSGTLTTAQPIGPGETWTARVEGLDVHPPTLKL